MSSAGIVRVRKGGCGMVKKGTPLVDSGVRELIGDGVVSPEGYSRKDKGLEKALQNLVGEMDRSLGKRVKIVKDEVVDAPKKISKKAKASKKIITVKHLAVEAGLEPTQVRRKLRSWFGKNEGRWEWEEGDPELAKIRAKLAK